MSSIDIIAFAIIIHHKIYCAVRYRCTGLAAFAFCYCIDARSNSYKWQSRGWWIYLFPTKGLAAESLPYYVLVCLLYV